jgi:hypothetical protein
MLARGERLNDESRIPQGRRARRTSRVLLVGALLCRVAALVVAAVGGHWLYEAFLLLSWMPVSVYRGRVIGLWLMDLLVFVVGLALGLFSLAFLGILIPAGAYVVHLGVVADQSRASTRRREDRTRMLVEWRTRMSAAPGDRETLEDVAAEMRDWWLTPTQAVRVACGAGAPADLAEDVVYLVVRWPGLEEPEQADEGWHWERLL